MSFITAADITLPDTDIACGKERYAELCSVLLRHMKKKSAIQVANSDLEDPWFMVNIRGWLLYAARLAADDDAVGVRRRYGTVTRDFAESFLGMPQAPTFIPDVQFEAYRQILMMRFVELTHPLMQTIGCNTSFKKYMQHNSEIIDERDKWLVKLIQGSTTLSAEMRAQMIRSHDKVRGSWSLAIPPGEDNEREVQVQFVNPVPAAPVVHPPGFHGHQPMGFLNNLAEDDGEDDEEDDEEDDGEEDEAPRMTAQEKRRAYQKRVVQRQPSGAGKKTAAAKKKAAANKRAAANRKKAAARKVGKGKYQRKRR